MAIVLLFFVVLIVSISLGKAMKASDKFAKQMYSTRIIPYMDEDEKRKENV